MGGGGGHCLSLLNNRLHPTPRVARIMLRDCADRLAPALIEQDAAAVLAKPPPRHYPNA